MAPAEGRVGWCERASPPEAGREMGADGGTRGMGVVGVPLPRPILWPRLLKLPGVLSAA